MPSKNFILWFDLETTGSESAKHDIIEFGAVLTDRDLNTIADFEATLRPPLSLNIFDINPVVIEMHVTNGLWADLIKQPNHRSYVTLQRDLLSWLDEVTKGEKQHIPSAGSGVSHFDRLFLKRFLPEFNARLTYWNLDIGVVRRFMELAGTPLPVALVEAKTHRALEDAYAHLNEARAWVDLMQTSLTTNGRLTETARCTSD